MRLLRRALWALLIPFLESFSEEVDKSFMEFLKYCQKSRLVFDLGIRLTVIQEQVGIDEVNGNKCWVGIVFPRKSFCCRYHAQLLTEITVCLKHNWCLLISKVAICMFGQNRRVHLYVFTSKLDNLLTLLWHKQQSHTYVKVGWVCYHCWWWIIHYNINNQI